MASGNGLPTPEAAKHPTIRATGLKGFLQWMQSDPAMAKVYARAKPQLAALIAQVNQQAAQLSGFGLLGDDTSSFLDVSALNTSMPSVDLTSTDATTASAPTTSDSTGWLSSLSSIVSAASQAALTADQIATANKVTNLQIQQAAAGKSPLNLSAYGLSTTPGVSVGLSTSTQSLLMYGGIALLGVWLLTSLTRRRA